MLQLTSTDVAIVGGGLSGSLLGYALKKRHPHVRVLLLEARPELDCAKTWSFHASDLPGEVYALFADLISHRWENYDVHFPNYSRTVNLPYCSFRPEKFYDKVFAVPGLELATSCPVHQVFGSVLQLQNQMFTVPLAFDARNPEMKTPCGYQKFFGLQVRLKKPHGLKRPILMDARIPQTDGYRFMYVLPWSETELLVEETFYSDTNLMDLKKSRQAVLEYIHQQGWEMETVLDEEHRALPIPLSVPQTPSFSSNLKIGVSGGFFHPITGYSVPQAAYVANRLSHFANLTPEKAESVLHCLRVDEKIKQKFLCFLNRLMFHAAVPGERYRIFEHFYRLPEPLIKRFYRGDLTALDQVRILSGKPPVPVWNALKTIFTPSRSYERPLTD